MRTYLLLTLCGLLVLGCGGSPGDAPGTEEPPGSKLIRHEDFESLQLPAPDWSRDPVPDDGPYSDAGSFFLQRGVKAPAAWRISAPFGEQGWLTFESYTRNRDTGFSRLA